MTEWMSGRGPPAYRKGVRRVRCKKAGINTITIDGCIVGCRKVVCCQKICCKNASSGIRQRHSFNFANLRDERTELGHSLVR